MHDPRSRMTLVFLLLSIIICSVSAQPTVSSVRGHLPGQELSPRAFGDTIACRLWPDAKIPYCFESDVKKLYQSLFKEGVKKWTGTGIPLTFAYKGICPEKRASDRSSVSKLLVVGTRKGEANSMAPALFVSTMGYTGERNGEATASYSPQKLWMPINNPLYSSSILGMRWRPRNNDQYATYVARALGHTLCLYMEHQRGTDEELSFKFENMASYSTANSSTRLRILASQTDRKLTAKLYDEGFPGPNFYRPPLPNADSWVSSQYDWNSIMSSDGSEYAQKGKRMMFKANGEEIDISHISGPSDNDVDMVKFFYRESAPSYPDDPLPLYEATIAVNGCGEDDTAEEDLAT